MANKHINKKKKTSLRIGDCELNDIRWEDLEKTFYELIDKFNYYSTLIIKVKEENSDIINNDPKLKEVIDGFAYSISDLINKTTPTRDRHLRSVNGRYVSIKIGQVAESGDDEVYEYMSIMNSYITLTQSLGDIVSKYYLGLIPVLRTKNNQAILDDLKEDIRVIRGDDNG